MSKHKQRVQGRRKTRARLFADKAHGELMEIYGRATQRGSADYLTVNQESELDRVAKLKHQAQERRERRNANRIQNAPRP